MGMTIDNCIDYYNRSFAIGDTDAARQHNDVLEMTIETMRKYQKIVEIVSLNGEEFKQCGLKELKEILEVIADGNDD